MAQQSPYGMARLHLKATVWKIVDASAEIGSEIVHCMGSDKRSTSEAIIPKVKEFLWGGRMQPMPGRSSGAVI